MPPEFLKKNAPDAATENTPEEKVAAPETTQAEKQGVVSPLVPTNPPPQIPLTIGEKDTKEFEPTWLKSLRTYKSDVIEAMQRGKGSLTRIVIAEKERETKRKAGEIEKEREARPKQTGEERDSAAPQKNAPTPQAPYLKTEVLPPRAPSSHLEALTVPPRAILSPEERESVHTRFMRKNIIIIVLSFLLAATGVLATYGAFSLLKSPKIPELIEITQAIIATEKSVQIPLEYLTQDELHSAIKKELARTGLPRGQMEAVYFIKNILIPGELETMVEKTSIGIIGPREIFAIIKNRAPSNLLRSLDDKSFLFGIHATSNNEVFLILKTDSFENAFSGMLHWEQNMFGDIAPLLDISISEQGAVSNTTFQDVVIKNSDARILKDDTGAVVLIYAFIDQETLVVTTNTATFDEVVKRLKTPKKILR